DSDALEQSAFLQHWPSSPHHTAHNRVMAFRERSKFLEKIAPHIGTKFVETRAQYLSGLQPPIVANAAEHAMLRDTRQGIAKQTPAVRIVLRPSSLAGKQLDRFLAGPFATVHVRPEDLWRPLVKQRQQVPQFYGIELNWSGGAEDHVLGVTRYRAKKHKQ